MSNINIQCDNYNYTSDNIGPVSVINFTVMNTIFDCNRKKKLQPREKSLVRKERSIIS